MGTLKTSELLQALWCQTWQLSRLRLDVAAAAALARRRSHLVISLWMSHLARCYWHRDDSYAWNDASSLVAIVAMSLWLGPPA
ncbi:hypothetical protein CA54_50050 [Symmachiella macrocystis]|uniref:Uncharacterized protein n=1 Tax=Symmachiella macrocystis TaxID=2527985 RepID=A0A5C6B3V5_9PLAN|nr:hypothetical protein CA54_50050 [Symmachiella macrocystis]